jgi:hypothetical protein
MLTIFSVFLVMSAHALTLTDVKNMALEHSETLKARESEEHALLSDAEIRGRWQNPQLMGQFGTLKSGSYQGATVEMSITQALPLSDKYSLRKEIATLALKTQKNRNEIFKNWVSHQALLSAWRVNVYQELFRHSSERARRLGIIKKYLETRPRVSVRQKVELNILSNILLQLEKMLDQKEFDLKVALSELEYWVGKRIEPRELEFRIPNLDVGVVPKSDIERDPDYLEAKVLTQSSELDFELAKKERRPDLFFGGGYRLEDVVPLNHFTYGILGLNMPLWDSGYERKQAAQARILRDQHNFRDIKRKVEIKQLKQIETVLFWAKQVQRFSHAHIPYQERAVDIAEDGFKKGLIDVNTFLQSETQSHEAVDQIYLSWFTYLENLSLLQLMRNESFSWEKI